MTIIIIQARMGSSRFPGKTMEYLDGYPVLHHVVSRCKATKFPVVVATPDTDDNQLIWEWCESKGVALFKGDEMDLTKRYYDCVQENRVADVIIRITADCPFINTELIVLAEKAFRSTECKKGYLGFHPVNGLNVEVFSRELLEEAIEHGPDEHCTTWMRSNPVFAVEFPSLEVNTQEQLDQLRKYYE